MQVKKYLHSCLLFSEGNERLLIDPGSFSFVEGKVKPEDIPPADVLLLTHEHPDHYYPEAIKIIAVKREPRIITHQALGEILGRDGFVSDAISAGDMVRHGSFTIQAVHAPHGDLPVPKPENLGFLINDTLFHPGDSLEFSLPQPPKILALPVTAPWLTLKQALDTAVRVKPEIVIPIHDAIMKDFMLERIYAMCEKILGEQGIAFKPLQLGETLEIH